MTVQQSDINLAESLRDIILACGIVPETVLTADADVGDQTIQVADNSRFAQGGILDFADLLGEEVGDIADLSPPGAAPQTIELDFTGTVPGLQFHHPAGTGVFTNLQTDAPAEIAMMLNLGDPFIYVAALEDQDKGEGSHKTWGPVLFHIQYQRLLTRPSDGTPRMSPNRWSKRQQQASRRDLDTIAWAIKQNRKLAVLNRPEAAVDLGDMTSPGRPIMQRLWRRMTANQDTEQFVAAIDLIVTKEFDPF